MFGPECRTFGPQESDVLATLCTPCSDGWRVDIRQWTNMTCSSLQWPHQPLSFATFVIEPRTRRSLTTGDTTNCNLIVQQLGDSTVVELCQGVHIKGPGPVRHQIALTSAGQLRTRRCRRTAMACVRRLCTQAAGPGTVTSMPAIGGLRDQRRKRRKHLPAETADRNACTRHPMCHRPHALCHGHVGPLTANI